MKKLLPLLLLAIALILIGYFYLDKIIVTTLLPYNPRQYLLLTFLGNQIPLLIVVFTFLFYGYTLFRFISTQTIIINKCLLYIANATAISLFIKDQLKIIFARYWPDTWVCGNPSFVENNAYGFHWFHGGKAYESFPSGHTTIAFAFCMAVFFFFGQSRWRWVSLLIALMVGLSQVILYFHFFSDVIAGATLGTLTAYCAHHYYITHKKSA